MAKCLTIMSRYATCVGMLLMLLVLAPTQYLFLDKYAYLKQQVQELSLREKGPTVWISSSVCWSSNTKFHKKEQFPYKLAAKLSTRLWHLKTNYSTVVQVIYEDRHKVDADLAEYLSDMRAIATKVEAVPTRGDIDCSLMAQLQRIFAFRLPYVGEKDVVVTTDVDAFVIDPDIFAPELKKDFHIWIFQYESTVKTGDGFPMSFLAMESRTWRRLLGAGSPDELLTMHRKEKFMPGENSSNSMWDLDQLLLTRLILSSGLCDLPKDNQVWKSVDLDPAAMPRNSSKESCFRGMKKWTNCNKSRTFIRTGCKWWHFYPDESKKQLWKAFRMIARMSS